jgi:hypothetical protein
MSDKKRWDDLHAAYAKAGEAANEYDRQLSRKYGSIYQSSWLKKGDRDKLDALRARADKIGDKIVELLVRVSPRGEAWLSGVPAHWIRSELTWEDAIRPKNEPLSVTPPSAWGGGAPIQETPMPQEHDAESAGAEYAQDQIENDYFMGWVREQMLEASRMDPSTVLPLETKSDARVIARNMLKQLEEDTKRGLDPREIASLIGVDSTTHDDVKEFFKGFSDTLRMNDAWLAGELLEINREMRGGGVSEARRRAAPASDLSRLHNPSIAGNIIVSNRKDFDRLLIERLGQIGRPDAVEIAREYKKLAAAYFGASRTPASTADEILDLEQRRRSGRRGVSEASRSGATKVKWVANGYDDGFHASVGRYFLKTVPVGGDRFVWSVSKGTKIVAGSEAIDPSWHGGYKGDPSEHGARVAAELAMTIHRTRSSRAAAMSESRRGPTPVEDPEYVIQGAYSDGRITESFGFDDEDTARSEAWKLSKSPYFEGDYVRIITRDGEIVWDSRGEGVGEAARSPADVLPIHIPEAAIEAAKKKYLDDLRAASPEQSEVWYQRQMERQPMFKNPGMYPWQFDLGGRRKKPRVGETRRPKARRPVRRRR